MSGIRVTVTDLDNGDTETAEIENDYILICDGNRYLADVQVAKNTGAAHCAVVWMDGDDL